MSETLSDDACNECGYGLVAGEHEPDCERGKFFAEIETLRAAVATLTQSNERLRAALQNVSTALTVEAAEYVPAIGDAFTIIDAALAAGDLGGAIA